MKKGNVCDAPELKSKGFDLVFAVNEFEDTADSIQHMLQPCGDL